MGWVKDSLIKQKRKAGGNNTTFTLTNKGCTNAIAHYLPTTAQLVPEQQPTASFPLVYTLSMISHGMEFWQVLGQLSCLCPLPASCAHSLLTGRWFERLKSPSLSKYCLGTTKDESVGNTALILNPSQVLWRKLTVLEPKLGQMTKEMYLHLLKESRRQLYSSRCNRWTGIQTSFTHFLGSQILQDNL